MRKRILSALLVAVLQAVVGCGGAPTDAPSAAPNGGTPSASVNPTCVSVREVNNHSTAALTTQIATAVAANERGDVVTAKQTIEGIRLTLSDWATALRRLADSTEDNELSAVITEYAGAVDASRTRTLTQADLEKLETFDDQELDTAASRLSEVCP